MVGYTVTLLIMITLLLSSSTNRELPTYKAYSECNIISFSLSLAYSISLLGMADFLNCKFSTLSYACYDEEIGDNGNNHLHLFLCLPKDRSFNSMRKHFAGANVQKKKGSAFFTLNYIRKPKGLILKGKEKDHTQIKPFVETGDFDLITEKGLYDKDGALLKEKYLKTNFLNAFYAQSGCV